jgi:hypothetical protein
MEQVFERRYRGRCRELRQCPRRDIGHAGVGSHFEKSSNDVAYRAAISLLALLRMIEGDELPSTVEADVVEMYSVVTKEFDDFRAVR